MSQDKTKTEPIVGGDGTRGPSTDPALDNAAAEAAQAKADAAIQKQADADAAAAKKEADAAAKKEAKANSQAKGGTTRSSSRSGPANQAKGGAVTASAKRFTITAPNSGFAGLREGVRFVDGQGEGTEAQATVLAQRGYQVAEIETDQTGSDVFPPGQNDLDLRTVPGIDWPTAVSLADAGVGNVTALSVADVDALAARTGRSVEEIGQWQAEARRILDEWEAGRGQLPDKKPFEDIAPSSMTPVNPPSTPEP